MKQIFLLLLIVFLFFTGCKKSSSAPDTNVSRIVLNSDLGGVFSIEGIVYLPDDAAVNRKIELSIYILGTTTPISVQNQNTTDEKRVKFEIREVPAGGYNIRMRIDQDGDGFVDSTGDYKGYWDGTVAEPSLVLGNARPLYVTDSNISDLEFGVNYWDL